MTSAQRGPWWRRSLAVLAAVAMTGGGLAVTAPAASAAPSDIQATSGSLDWGVKASFRNYMAMPFAKGSITVADGASKNGDGTFKFPAVSVNPADQLLTFGGSVSFSAHEGQLAVEISDIRVDLNRQMLVADVVSKAMTGEGSVTYDDVDLTTVGAGGVIGDGTAGGTALPTTLTAAGSPAFASNYPAGADFDPLTFAASYVVPVAAPVVTAQPAAQTVEDGTAVSFTANADGFDAVTWQVLAAGAANWSDIAKATSTSLNFTATLADAGSSYRAAFSNAGGVVFSDPALLTVTEVEAPAPVFVPELKVFAADGSTPLAGPVAEGTKIVVKGSGFDPVANAAPEGSRPPIAAGQPAGTYVVFGKFADQWRPSEGAPSSARVVGDQRWALSQAAFDAVPPAFQGAIRGQWVVVSPEGEFTTELTVAKKQDKGVEVDWPETGNFGVYTYAAGGTKNAEQELYVPVTVDGEVTVPELTVEPATGLKHESRVTVSGTGYAANRWIYVAEAAQGPGGDTRPAVYENAVRVQTDAEGNFGPLEFTVTTVFENGGFNAVDNTLFIATFNSPLDLDNAETDYSNDRSQDAFVELAWADPSAPVIPEPEEPETPATLSADTDSIAAGKSLLLRGKGFAPGAELSFDANGKTIEPGRPASSDVTGGLDWGIKGSFLAYLNGPIAKGSAATAGGAAENKNGTFHFPAASYDAVNKVAGYAGSVSMTGHDDALQVKIENLRVDVLRKALIADVTSKSLEGASKSYTNVSLVALDTANVTADALGLAGKNLGTVLTGSGAPAFADFYSAGEVFDALSFDIAGPAAGQTLSVALDGTFTVQWAVPGTQKPGKYTITATGTSSAPEVRAEVQTQKASVQVQITEAVKEPDVTPPATPPATSGPATAPSANATCTNGGIVGGTLNWGVKESFRNYITGNVAKGAITFNGARAARDTIFAFTNGRGTFDAQKRSGTVTFDGVLTFQGHDYGSGAVLSVVMDNITLVLDGNAGTLRADVTSRSLESATEGARPGADVSYDSVVLATLDASAAALNDVKTVYAGSGVQATLASSGVAPFADFYAAGDALDSLSFALGCSADAELNAAGGAAHGGSTGKLAATGATAMDASIIAAFLILLMGAGTLANNRAARRR